jgi:hypothetical protein
VSVRLRPGVLIDDAQLPIVNAATAETLLSRMNVQPNVRNAHCLLWPNYIPLNPDISLLYTVGNMLIPDIRPVPSHHDDGTWARLTGVGTRARGGWCSWCARTAARTTAMPRCGGQDNSDVTSRWLSRGRHRAVVMGGLLDGTGQATGTCAGPRGPYLASRADGRHGPNELGPSGPGQHAPRDGGRDARAGSGSTRTRLAAAAAGATEGKGRGRASLAPGGARPARPGAWLCARQALLRRRRLRISYSCTIA